MSDWRSYENLVYNYYCRTTNSNWDVKYDVNIEGKSDTRRQIDILLTDSQESIKILIECKFYSKRVGIKSIESIIGMMKDVNAHKAVIVSPKGFSKPAIRRAKEFGRMELLELSMDDLFPYRFVDNDEVILNCDECSKRPNWFTNDTFNEPILMREYDVVKNKYGNYIRFDNGECCNCSSIVYYCNECQKLLYFPFNQNQKGIIKYCDCNIGIHMLLKEDEFGRVVHTYNYIDENKNTLEFESNFLHKYGY